MDSMSQIALQIEQSLASYLPAKMRGPEALAMLLAIGCQESRFKWRKQIGGPARGYWMFEENGVIGVMNHPWSEQYARRLCDMLNIPFAASVIHHEMAENFDLAACFARLLLYTDSQSLPEVGQAITAWHYYIRNWRPGKPRQRSWCSCYLKAINQEGSNG